MMGSSLLLTHLSRSWPFTANPPSDLTSLFQLVLPEDLDKSLGTGKNRRVHWKSENRDMLISILNSSTLSEEPRG